MEDIFRRLTASKIYLMSYAYMHVYRIMHTFWFAEVLRIPQTRWNSSISLSSHTFSFDCLLVNDVTISVKADASKGHM